MEYLAGTRELEIAAPRADGGLGPWTLIWVVVVDDRVFVRTWHRRTTGWYGRAAGAAAACIRVSEHPVAVTVEITGAVDADAVDAAYRFKYGVDAAQSMVTAEARASTLRLRRHAR